VCEPIHILWTFSCSSLSEEAQCLARKKIAGPHPERASHNQRYQLFAGCSAKQAHDGIVGELARRFVTAG
jgi:hypothetical protein